jgi:hypothetical protein
MEDDIRNLLVGIGQPAFSYRNFDQEDHKALLVKWPLMALVARSPELRSVPLGQTASREQARSIRTTSSVKTVPAASFPRSGFLGNYDAAAVRPNDESARDIRSLLGRLSGDPL